MPTVIVGIVCYCPELLPVKTILLLGLLLALVLLAWAEVKYLLDRPRLRAIQQENNQRLLISTAKHLNPKPIFGSAQRRQAH